MSSESGQLGGLGGVDLKRVPVKKMTNMSHDELNT